MVVVTRREGFKASRAPGPYPNSVSGARSRFHVPDLVLRMGVCAPAVVETVQGSCPERRPPCSNAGFQLLRHIQPPYLVDRNILS